MRSLGFERPDFTRVVAFSHQKYMAEYSKIRRRLEVIQDAIQAVNEDIRAIETYKQTYNVEFELQGYRQYSNSGQNF